MALAGKTMRNNSPWYRSDIDGLRAIAVLGVLGFHASPFHIRGGFVGVDIFFVISGYLISKIIFEKLDKGTFSFGNFYASRIKRILPALILVLAATLVLGWCLLVPLDYKRLAQHVMGAIGFVSNFVLWNEAGYFDVYADLKPLLHIWSLSIEEQFYLLWPLILVIIHKLSIKRTPIILVLLLLSLTGSIYLVGHDKTAAFYFPLTRAWELLVGAMVAQFSLHGKNVVAALARKSGSFLSERMARNLLSGVGLILLLVAFRWTNNARAFPGYWAMLPTVGTALLIISGPGSFISEKFLSNKLMIQIGLISYPLYLWHWIFLSFLRIEGLGEPLIYRVAVVALSFLLAWITYRFVEIPIRFGTVPLRQRKVVFGLVASMLFLGAVGFYIDADDGFAMRYPDTLRPFLAAKYQYKKEFRNSECMLSEQEVVFSPKCIETENYKKGFPLIMLWGDSHASHLFRAIEALHSEAQFALAQYTSSSCPPFLNFEKLDRPYCGMLNKVVEEKIRILRPATVILAHDWPQSVNENSLDHLSETVQFLRANGVVHIVLVGPVPHWQSSLGDAMTRYLKQTGTTEIPVRTKFGLDPSIPELDAKLMHLAQLNGITYIAPLSVLCNAEGCLTIANEKTQMPSSFDNAHLTLEGSKILVNAVKEKFGAPFSKASGGG
ncbi:peptidoglycan/LPS O-acetylase OafA/YrhL [Herbaspirillum sp. Sphag1AN]|uniref:acyltransferase family protein n=1 Tax=unclassified Herbaspirillum TaxID=2624150 RepID=UPI00161378FB|nr:MULTISPECIES: acyltransferase family protein [unclassified Herbaspirillum]MBB3212984.1 peptidoglycan/LPS O-acetylase OafA/YrhL [Herbaspirillum sp. Sphag1AN]MBB3246181.1 peptidoglycan/LPS O-acetylase OafA/YrhL [Herbaspirillum sp. Sphag64]